MSAPLNISSKSRSISAAVADSSRRWRREIVVTTHTGGGGSRNATTTTMARHVVHPPAPSIRPPYSNKTVKNIAVQAPPAADVTTTTSIGTQTVESHLKNRVLVPPHELWTRIEELAGENQNLRQERTRSQMWTDFRRYYSLPEGVFREFSTRIEKHHRSMIK